MTVIHIPSGEIVATGVSEEEYLEKYAELHCEWVNGTVVKMAPATFRHNMIIGYLYMLLNAYFDLKPIGVVGLSPFLQRLSEIHSNREPDLIVVLNSNVGELTSTAMNGAADICIEVVSRRALREIAARSLRNTKKAVSVNIGYSTIPVPRRCSIAGTMKVSTSVKQKTPMATTARRCCPVSSSMCPHSGTKNCPD